MRVRCKICGHIFEVEEDKVNEDYMQCPFCGEISNNPFK